MHFSWSTTHVKCNNAKIGTAIQRFSKTLWCKFQDFQHLSLLFMTFHFMKKNRFSPTLSYQTYINPARCSSNDQYTACPRKTPPKYNGVVLEIRGKHHWNFTTEFGTYLKTASKNSWKFNVKIAFYYAFNYSSKTQVSVTTRTHARSLLSPMKQCDYSSIVITFFLMKNFN